MAMIELVDFNTLYNGGKKEVKKTTRRGKVKKAEGAPEAPVADTTVADQTEETSSTTEATE
jgi:large subunit ribosomal protein L17